MSAQTKGLAALLAAHGRNGDTELMHVTKGEIAALNRLKRGIDGADLPRNPKTGLTEANFFRDYAPQLGMAAGAGLGVALAPFTAGTSLALTPAVAGAIGGAAGGGLGSVARGDDTQNALINTAAGGLGGYGIGSMAAGLGATGGAAAATTPGASASTTGTGLVPPPATPTPPPPITTVAPGEFAPTAFDSGVKTGLQAYEGGGSSGLKMTGDVGIKPNLPNIMSPTGAPPVTGTPPVMGTPPAAEQFTGAGLQPRPGVGIQPEVGGGIKTDYLLSKEALGNAIPIAGSAAAMTPGANDVTTETAGIDRTLPESEVYYTDTGERRTRIVDRPRFGNVNMARGGDVYGDYEGVDEAPDGGYRPGGGLNYAGGGLAGTGWGEQTQGGFAGLTSSLQPGGAVGDWHGRVYGALGADQVMPGGAGGSLIPGANQYNAKKREEEERKRAEEEAGIAAAAKAKQDADYKQQWSDIYGQRMAEGGISALGHYSDGGQLLRGAGDGVSDSIPASIEGKRPARLADGEFVVPARAVSELGNGSTEAGSKQLYAMLDRIAKKRKSGKGLAYQANPKKILPA